jgi:hypothetical protein
MLAHEIGVLRPPTLPPEVERVCRVRVPGPDARGRFVWLPGSSGPNVWLGWHTTGCLVESDPILFAMGWVPWVQTPTTRISPPPLLDQHPQLQEPQSNVFASPPPHQDHQINIHLASPSSLLIIYWEIRLPSNMDNRAFTYSHFLSLYRIRWTLDTTS